MSGCSSAPGWPSSSCFDFSFLIQWQIIYRWGGKWKKEVQWRELCLRALGMNHRRKCQTWPHELACWLKFMLDQSQSGKIGRSLVRWNWRNVWCLECWGWKDHGGHPSLVVLKLKRSITIILAGWAPSSSDALKQQGPWICISNKLTGLANADENNWSNPAAGFFLFLSLFYLKINIWGNETQKISGNDLLRVIQSVKSARV